MVRLLLGWYGGDSFFAQENERFHARGESAQLEGAFVYSLLQERPRLRREDQELLYTLYFKNVQDYVEKIKKQIGYMPFIWGVLIKHVIPPVLIVVFVLGAVATNSEGESVFGHYGGYVAWPYQILGVLTFCFTAATMLVGAAAPNLYNWTFVPQVEGSFVGEDEKFPVEESEEQDVEQIDESNPEKAQAEDEESEAVEKPVAVAAETKADAEAEAVA